MDDYGKILCAMSRGVKYSYGELFDLVKGDLYNPKQFKVRLEALVDHAAVHCDGGVYELCARKAA